MGFDNKKIVLVMPARYGSSRFPGKPLAMVNNKSLIQHAYEVAVQARYIDAAYVATDDRRIADNVEGFGGKAVMTAGDLRTGSDRVGAVAAVVPADYYINMQSDEILSTPQALDDLIEHACGGEEDFSIATLKKKIESIEEVRDTNVVKVVSDCNDIALYFSRLPIPFIRDGSLEEMFESVSYFKHYGIYLFSREALELFTQHDTGGLEQLEKLEQLRAMEVGMKIKLFKTSVSSIRIDTPEDLQANIHKFH